MARWLSFRVGLLVALVAGRPSGAETLPSPAEVQPKGATKPPAQIEEEGDNVIVPIVLYTPETHVGLGGLFVHFFRPPPERKHARVSSVAFLAIATTRRQAIVEAHPDFYFMDEDLHLFAKLEYQYFPDSFWGVGSRTPDRAEERYRRERLRFRPNGLYRMVGRLYGGLSADAMEYRAEYGDGGLFATQDFPGERGGVTAGFGPALSYDSRDNPVSARSGTLLGATFLWFPKPTSRYAFRKLLLEARQFFDLGRTHAIGARFYGELQGGNTPYYHLAMLGGDELLRGYYLGRYRDETLVALEAEYRYPLFWRFGGVLFAGAGQVADDPVDLPSEPLRWAVGGGLRFSLADRERLNLRFDLGFAPTSWGAYFTAREAF